MFVDDHFLCVELAVSLVENVLFRLFEYPVFGVVAFSYRANVLGFSCLLNQENKLQGH